MGLKKLILDLKIYYKINFRYPQLKKFRRIKSIIPISIKLGEEIVIDKNVILSHKIESIGNAVYVGSGTLISNCKSIGNYTSISNDVKIGMPAHPQHFISTSPFFYAKRRGNVEENLYDECKGGLVEIGNDVLISANAIILTGVKIGNGAIVGAGAMVNKDVPDYAVVAGIPAKILKYRFNESQIQQLVESQWWNYNFDVLKSMANYSSDISLFLEELSKKSRN